jgi:phosphoesterase RecJ-like protein
MESNIIAVVSHIRPDGDAVGSVLGLGLALQAVGKNVQMILEDGIPKTFRHLHGSDQILNQIRFPIDCSIILDCSDKNRTGNIFSSDIVPDINIDHHKTNVGFGKINIINVASTSTTEMLSELLPIWGVEINQQVAEALLTGMITDTIGFRVPSVTPNTLRIAAELYEKGANLPNLYAKALLGRSYRAARYWGAGLSALRLDNRLLWTKLTLEDRIAVKYPGRDDADLINMLQSVEGADIFIIFVEQSEDKVKVSWRARKGFDVSTIATSFGGGGHAPAAGAEIKGKIDDVIENVLSETRTLLNTHSN